MSERGGEECQKGNGKRLLDNDGESNLGLIPQHTKFPEKQTGRATRDTYPTAMRGDAIFLDAVDPPKHPRAVLSGSHSTGSPPWQVHQMLKMRRIEQAGGFRIKKWS